MILNRSRSGGQDQNEESDQSILDDHVARNFPLDTPPVPRSPPGAAASMKSKSSKHSGATRSSRSGGSGATTKTLLHQSFDSRYDRIYDFGNLSNNHNIFNWCVFF